MSITLPKPEKLISTIIKSRVPGWVLVAAVVAQFTINHATQPHDPTCAIKFEKIHYSTSNFRNLNKDSVKLNLKTSCSAAQKYSEITAEISTLENGKPTQIYRSVRTKENASIKNSSEAEFLEFWVPCEKNSIKEYKGFAHGDVLLQNGTVIPVSDDTGKYLAVLCNFKAK